MTRVDSVRLSRAGDQFHYLWAARRCLRLLSYSTDLVAVTIEGVSAEESSGSSNGHGEEVIDVAEYYSSESLCDCSKVIYYQLKHSTINSNRPWRLSDLKKTFTGFAKRYRKFLEETSDPELQQVKFVFLTNRAVADWVHKLLKRIKRRKLKRTDSNKWQQIKSYLSANDKQAYEFLDRFQIDDTADGYWEQRNILNEQTRSYLSGSDRDCADQLLLLVTRKALPESSRNPSIRREDVLRALYTDEDSLFPAPCLIESGEKLFQRSQERGFIEEILKNDGPPIIIHAEAGLGKSAIARRLNDNLTEQATVVLFDCFGNGTYRSPTGARHRHNVGLVQIANELASSGFCHPLIPTNLASPTNYLKAFDHRMNQAIKLLKASDPKAKIVLIIDAADNAQLAADELGENTSFPRDLLSHQFPDGVVLVCISRTHRVPMLTPPPEFVELKLLPYKHDETALFLRQRFPNATNDDVAEFHYLTSQNPRVQITSLENCSSLSETFEFLGPEPRNVEETIRAVFEKSIKNLTYQSPEAEAFQIGILCEALAALRPFIPIETLSMVSGLNPQAIRSFVTDLGRPILVRADAVQFADESTETWFRNKYKPAKARLSEIVEKLLPLSAKSAYIASALPQLMLEAGRYKKLVKVTLSETGLPSSNPLEKRQISHFRLQFALKAALRKNRYKDAAKLALKAGSETAGDDRQQLLIQENTSFVSKLLSEEQLREIIVQNNFKTEWHGGHRVYEAGLFAGNSRTIIEARNVLRVAYKWLHNWAQLDSEARRKEKISLDDIAEMAWVRLNIDGPEALVSEIGSWKPSSIAYEAGLLLSKNLVDLGEFACLDQISLASKNNIYLLLSTIDAQSSILRYPPHEVIEVAVGGVLDQKNFDNLEYGEEFSLSTVVAVAQAAIHYRSWSHIEIAKALEHYIPQPSENYLSDISYLSRFTVLRAKCLQANLATEDVNILDFATPKVREQLESIYSYHGREAQDLSDNVSPTLIWHKLWVNVFLGEISSDQIVEEIAQCLEESKKHFRFRIRDNRIIEGEIAKLWVEIIAHYDDVETLLEQFRIWKSKLERSLFIPDLVRLIQISTSVTSLHQLAFELAFETSKLIHEERMGSEDKIDGYCNIARAIFVLNKHEAKCYFDRSVEIAGKLGQEHTDYWTSIIEFASSAAIPECPRPDLAYRVSRANEVVYDIGAGQGHFDWEGTLTAIADLCPTSVMTILSRWRERNFVFQREIFPVVVRKLAELRVVDSKCLLAVIGFQNGHAYIELLDETLRRLKDNHFAKLIYMETVRYVLVGSMASSELKKLIEIGERNGWSTEKVSAALQKSNRKKMCSDDTVHLLNDLDEAKLDWNRIFSDLNSTSRNSIRNSYERFCTAGRPFLFSSFVSNFYKRVATGKESESIQTLSAVFNLSFLKLGDLFEALPNTWLLQQSAKQTLSDLVKNICRQHYHEIRKSRYYQQLPFQKIEEVTGISESDIYKMVVDESSQQPNFFESQRLFELAGMIATTLTPEEAQDVLNFGLNFLEIDMNDDDGDGQWKSEELAPPSVVEASLAGYIWSCLAAPEVELRWQAAHVVRLLCLYRSVDALDTLADLAMGDVTNVFSDASLPFYDFAAKQWLLIALLRAVQDGDNLPQKIVEFVKCHCRPSEKHLMIRGLAAEVLLKLYQYRNLDIDVVEVTRLSAINQPKCPIIESNSSSRVLCESGIDGTVSNESFYFVDDISQYWFGELGRKFSYSSTDIARRATLVIQNYWDLDEDSNGMRDPRAKRNLYIGDSHHSHGTYPKTEYLNFYQSYHSMMIVAGDLIDTVQAHQDPDYSDEVESWIRRHWLTRTDGKWLADRRDVNPNKWPDWKGTEETDEWPFSVSRSDLMGVLIHDENSFAIWGRWSETSGDREQHVDISSALVSQGTSRALLHALQTADNPSNFHIPSSKDDPQIVTDQYLLKGWVTEGSRDLGIDEYDPWAGRIEYPPLHPADWFCDTIGLYADDEKRSWSSSNDLNEVVLRSFSWGRNKEQGEFESPESGSLVTANRVALLRWLKALEMNLIVNVRIRREFRYDSFRIRNKSTSDRLVPYFLILVIDANGEIFTI